MSRKQRVLKKRYAVFCEGDTEYNYTDKMRKKQGVELVLKPTIRGIATEVVCEISLVLTRFTMYGIVTLYCFNGTSEAYILIAFWMLLLMDAIMGVAFLFSKPFRK